MVSVRHRLHDCHLPAQQWTGFRCAQHAHGPNASCCATKKKKRLRVVALTPPLVSSANLGVTVEAGVDVHVAVPCVPCNLYIQIHGYDNDSLLAVMQTAAETCATQDSPAGSIKSRKIFEPSRSRRRRVNSATLTYVRPSTLPWTAALNVKGFSRNEYFVVWINIYDAQH